jgi:hypothetical protein
VSGSPSAPEASTPVPVRLQTRFERFPASIKGAFVLRGGDGDPHAVWFDWASVVRIPSGPRRPIALEERQLDVAPNRDLFVPFEVPVAEMEPSWYAVESSLRVDGARSYTYVGRPFTIPWPRSEVRKGTIHLSKTIRAGASSFHVERVELGWDTAAVLWQPKGAGEGKAASDEIAAGPRALLIADEEELEELPDQAGSKLSEPRGPQERRSLSYPVMRSARSLRLVIRLPSGKSSEPLLLQVP